MVEKRDFIYSPKGANRPLQIYLPEDYDASQERYPVMYFFDGHNLFFDEDATYGKSWGLKEFLDNWDQKIILVGIECGHEGNERLVEYLPAKSVLPPLLFKTPMGSQTMDWIVEEIKPMIDREYRTMPERENTAIGGSSMGGLMALLAIVKYNRWFSKAACVSIAFEVCYRDLLPMLRSTPLESDTKVYMSWGTMEAFRLKDPTKNDTTSVTHRKNMHTAKLLKKGGADVKLLSQVGGKHCEAHWEMQNPTYMNYLWK
jgi:predicted alpha/beta superfamily hydrolase